MIAASELPRGMDARRVALLAFTVACEVIAGRMADLRDVAWNALWELAQADPSPVHLRIDAAVGEMKPLYVTLAFGAAVFALTDATHRPRWPGALVGSLGLCVAVVLLVRLR